MNSQKMAAPGTIILTWQIRVFFLSLRISDTPNPKPEDSKKIGAAIFAYIRQGTGFETFEAAMYERFLTDSGFLANKKKPQIQRFAAFRNGGSCGIRTYDQLVKSQLLYQLS
jgi:hypothetical protein